VRAQAVRLQAAEDLREPATREETGEHRQERAHGRASSPAASPAAEHVIEPAGAALAADEAAEHVVEAAHRGRESSPCRIEDVPPGHRHSERAERVLHPDRAGMRREDVLRAPVDLGRLVRAPADEDDALLGRRACTAGQSTAPGFTCSYGRTVRPSTPPACGSGSGPPPATGSSPVDGAGSQSCREQPPHAYRSANGSPRALSRSSWVTFRAPRASARGSMTVRLRTATSA
jgi:hypothetical protein